MTYVFIWQPQGLRSSPNLHYKRKPYPFFITLLTAALMCMPIYAISGNLTNSPLGRSTQSDTIQLTSKEWLIGKLKASGNNTVQFHSHKLGLLSIDWQDIIFLSTTHIVNVTLLDNPTLKGTLHVNTTDIIITDASNQSSTFNRNALISITSGEDQEISYWSGNIGVSASLRKGNSEQTEYNIKTSAKRRTPTSRITLDYQGLAESNDNEDTAENHRISATWDVFDDPKLFYRPVFFELFHDTFQNINLRTTAGVGIGYHLYDTSTTEWTIAGGPAIQHTTFKEVSPDENKSETTEAIIGTTAFDITITDTIDINGQYRIHLTDKKSGGSSHHATTALGIELTNKLKIDISLVWDHIQHPKPSEDSQNPKRDDIRLLLGINWDF